MSSRPESNGRKSYEQQQQEDKESCHHFGLDLELPHPDHYLPETGWCTFYRFTYEYGFTRLSLHTLEMRLVMSINLMIAVALSLVVLPTTS